ncbi:hypothetical protein V8C42DRAFT_177067 [Trichoderma barbatum]
MSSQSVVKIGPPSSQKESLLMQLPRELRDAIYAFLFSSTRFGSGRRQVQVPIHRQEQFIFPAPHGLALLRSCRQAYAEIGKTWLRHVHFCFESPEDMLNKLARIPLETRSDIRSIRVLGDSLATFDMADAKDRISQLFELLPGLKLDVLTVLDDSGDYKSLDLLVKFGKGWKELHYISKTSDLVGYVPSWVDWDNLNLWYQQYWREPQPSGWQQNLEDRDGSNSGASVTIYRSTIPHRAGSVLQAATRAEFTQVLHLEQDLKSFNKEKDPQLTAPGEREKEMLVIVKRGRGVDYEEKPGSRQRSDQDIRNNYYAETWKEVKAARYKRAGLDPDVPHYRQDEEDDEYDEFDDLLDRYNHVDDYEWPPFKYVEK